jgi:mono/diheme cytochrome c family protein
MPHLSELHGAATHLATVAIPAFAVLLLLHRADLVTAAVPKWVLICAGVGVVLAGATGLLVWGQSKTELRGGDYSIGNLHFWLGIATAAAVALALVRRLRVAAAILALGLVVAQGYLGGRMAYDRGVGVQAAGEYRQTAVGASRLAVALATGTGEVAAGRAAFSASGLGCADCHGDRAQGERGPRLAGGRDLADFRHVHANGLFPPQVVTDRDFRAIDAYLKTLGRAAD